MLSMDVFKPARAECKSRITFVRIEHRRFCLCPENRKLDAMLIDDSNPVLHMGEWVDYLSDGTIVSAIDTNVHHSQVNIADIDPDSTTFTSGHAYPIIPF